jgi:hypothetical protein
MDEIALFLKAFGATQPGLHDRPWTAKTSFSIQVQNVE